MRLNKFIANSGLCSRREADLAPVAVHVGKGVGGDGAVFQFDAVQDPVEVFFLQVPVELRAINLADPVGGVGEFLREFAVVGQEQHARGGLVETSHRIDALRAEALGDEVHHGPVGVRIGQRGDEAFGLVHHEIDFLLAFDAGPVEPDVVFGRIDLRAQFGDSFSVDGNLAGFDERVGVTARADAGIGDVFVETDESVAGGSFLFHRKQTCKIRAFYPAKIVYTAKNSYF